MELEPQSGVDLLVPSASPLVADWYGQSDAATQGMPPHVTLLWPWRRPPLMRRDINAAGAAPADFDCFNVKFDTIGRFPGWLFLEPEPLDPFRRMTAALAAAFPEHPPYSGQISVPHPHLTVASGTDNELDQVAGKIEARLKSTPLNLRVDAITVSERSAETGWRWSPVARLPLKALS